MTSYGASSGAACRVAERLVGVEVPSLELENCFGGPLNLGLFAGPHSVVLYCYPGERMTAGATRGAGL
jgi:peroxiredoxin